MHLQMRSEQLHFAGGIVNKFLQIFT